MVKFSKKPSCIQTSSNMKSMYLDLTYNTVNRNRGDHEGDISIYHLFCIMFIQICFIIYEVKFLLKVSYLCFNLIHITFNIISFILVYYF